MKHQTIHLRRILIIILCLIVLASMMTIMVQAGISLDENLSYRQTFDIIGRHEWIVLGSIIGILLVALFPDFKKHLE